MPKFHLPCVALLIGLSLPAVAGAQPAPLVTDRPDFTESPFVVPLRSIQIEAGLTRNFEGRRTETSGPEALVRWSPARSFEIRFEPPGYVQRDSLRDVTEAGVGVKFEVGRLRAWSVGAIASVGFPMGGTEASADGLAPEVILTAGRELGDAWTLGTQASAGRSATGGRVLLASTLVVGRALTDRLGAFLEVATEGEPGASVSSGLHAGLAFLLSPTVQLDVHAFRSVGGGGVSTAVGLGVSTRFDYARRATPGRGPGRSSGGAHQEARYPAPRRGREDRAGFPTRSVPAGAPAGIRLGFPTPVQRTGVSGTRDG